MMKTLTDVMNTVPQERRAKIEARAEMLIAEKKAKDLTQKRLEDLLEAEQDDMT